MRLPCDWRRPASTHRVLLTDQRRRGQGDRRLVLDAGARRFHAALALMPPQDWHAVIDTNLTGTFNACRATVLGRVRHRAGAIVNISSVVGLRGNGAQTNCAAAKAGIDGLSR